MNAAEFLSGEVARRGVKYVAISSATGIPVDALSKSFMGKRNLTADEMLKVSSFLGLKLGALDAVADSLLAEGPKAS